MTRSQFARRFDIFVLIQTRLSAQMVGAIVSGPVADSSGAAIAGENIATKNASTGSIANAVTNAVGVFDAPNLPRGTYELTASAPGFLTLVRNGINFTVGLELVF
jgi:Carboxypeptidase regulatory-like domain